VPILPIKDEGHSILSREIFKGFILIVRRILLVVGLPMLLLGCASPPPPPAPAAPDTVSTRLDSVIQAAPVRDIHADTQRPAAVFTWERVEVDYFGDASVLLRQMAQGLSLEFVVTGPTPHLPIFVQVSSSGKAMEEVWRRMALQLGGRADVVLRDTMIGLRYLPHR